MFDLCCYHAILTWMFPEKFSKKLSIKERDRIIDKRLTKDDG